VVLKLKTQFRVFSGVPFNSAVSSSNSVGSKDRMTSEQKHILGGIE
jgi:hypothetical protein